MNFVSVIQDLASILGLDDVITLNKVHASLTDSVGMESKSISSETLSKLARTVLSLKEDKKQRLEKVISLNSMFLFYFYCKKTLSVLLSVLSGFHENCRMPCCKLTKNILYSN